MTQPFFHRLRAYYLKVAEVLRGEADAASIFPNSTDVGISRELVYLEFLRKHVPSKCNVFVGGFLFDDDGNESKQLDIIVTTDTAPRFSLHSFGGGGKSFSHVEGTIGVVTIKSRLDKAQLEDALVNIASIPATKPLEGRMSPFEKVEDYEDWPYKVVYSTEGLEAQTILAHMDSFYQRNATIPIARRPHLIHVAGKYVIFRAVPGLTAKRSTDGKEADLGTFVHLVTDSDLQGIVWVLDNLQLRAAASTHIFYSYRNLINKVNLVSI